MAQQKIGIGVSADLDTSAVEQKINEFGRRVAQANKVKFEPLKDTAKDDLDKIIKQFDQLLRVHTDLNRRIRATGQEGKSLFDVDWDRLYLDPRIRARQMRSAFEYGVGGATRHSPIPPVDDGSGREDRSRSTISDIGSTVAQSGLGALGPAGGVAAGALRTGMASGIGAGLAGLLGGMLALTVGKAVGAAIEKMGQAENLAVSYDRLKRALGDVNVAFDMLKGSIVGSGGMVGVADTAKVTWEEATKLTSQFVQLGNVTKDQYTTISQDLHTGIGLSRSFGLDPEQGVSALAQMRGARVTSNWQENRRFALLIGETIGKSDAFARADEVMQALANYATLQTRNAMVAANTEGFAGLYSSMVGSGLPGLDPTSANALIGRINASLSAGGAKGEASQFFSAMVADQMGLDPFQMMVLREGGAFATTRSMLGSGSRYADFMGSPMDGTDTTWYDATRAMVERQYSGDDYLSKRMRAMAFSSHLGVSLGNAMALLSLEPNQMGGLQRYAGNLGELNAEGISNLYSVVYGSESERVGVANRLYSQGNLSDSERAELNRVMKSGSAEDQRELLGQLVSIHDQEQTQGKDIRDSKTALENIKMSIADRLIPLTQEMRHGIMYLAGDRGKISPMEIMKSVIDVESSGRVSGIRSRYSMQREEAGNPLDALGRKIDDIEIARSQPGVTPEQNRAYVSQIAALREQRDGLAKQIANERRDLSDKEAAAIAEENRRRDREKEKLDEAGAAALPDLDGAPVPAGGPYVERGIGGGLPKSVGAQVPATTSDRTDKIGRFINKYGAAADKVAGELDVPVDAVLAQWALETAWGEKIIPGTNNLGNIKDFTGKGPKATDNMTGSVDSYRTYSDSDAFADGFVDFLKGPRYKKVPGSDTPQDYFNFLHKAGYAEDPDYVSKGVSISKTVRNAMSDGTPLPPDASAVREQERQGVHVTFGSAEVTLKNERGEAVSPPVLLNPRVNAPVSFGVGGAW